VGSSAPHFPHVVVAGEMFQARSAASCLGRAAEMAAEHKRQRGPRPSLEEPSAEKNVPSLCSLQTAHCFEGTANPGNVRTRVQNAKQHDVRPDVRRNRKNRAQASATARSLELAFYPDVPIADAVS
jgi:hypothetical protein